MFQNNDKDIPASGIPDGKNALQQEGGQVAAAAANQAVDVAGSAAGEKAAETTDKAKQATQTAQQVATYAITAQQLSGGAGQ